MPTDPVPPVHFFFWVAFNLGVLALLAIDLLVFHRKAHAVGMREAAIWSVVFVALSLLFNIVIWQWRGPQAGLEFLTGYLVEKSLSVDNIFVFVLIFSYFKVPPHLQHRVLFWGIIGALVMRGLMIWMGVALVENFHWIIYVFGAFLVYTGYKMFSGGQEELEPEHNPLVRLCQRMMPVTKSYRESHFAVKEEDRWKLTPLAIVLVMVESTDLLFAVDSIPAIIAITRDPFIVYTSNVCAILGLRALYFLLADIIPRFIYLRPALAVILTFVGVKMLLSAVLKIPTLVSLSFILLTLVIATLASIKKSRESA